MQSTVCSMFTKESVSKLLSARMTRLSIVGDWISYSRNDFNNSLSQLKRSAEFKVGKYFRQNVC